MAAIVAWFPLLPLHNSNSSNDNDNYDGTKNNNAHYRKPQTGAKLSTTSDQSDSQSSKGEKRRRPKNPVVNTVIFIFLSSRF
jgi:hypothetical protein